MSISPLLTAPSAPNTVAFWRGYWLTLRPYLFCVSGASGLIGLALAPGLSRPGLMMALLAFFLAYGLGQALTDVFQTDTDALSAPFRPLVRGEIARSDVLIISLIGLTVCAAVLVVLNPANLGLSIAAVAGLLTYTWFKRRWWGGPLWNSWIVALLPIMGFLCGGASFGDALSSAGLAAGVLSVFFSYAVFVLLGYFKDISADRSTGYRTLPVVASWNMSIGVSALCALAAIVSGTWLLLLRGAQAAQLGPGAAVGMMVWLGGIAMFIRAHVVMFGVNDEHEAHRAIASAVRGHLLLHLGLAAVVKPGLMLPALAIYLIFEAALATRPERTQI